jgi:hypothetical protein
MQGARDLLSSERGTFCLALLITVTLLVIIGKITGIDWLTYTKWIALTLVASKTVTGAVETITGAAQQTPTAST